jgi:hypothetical protein
MSFNDHVAGEFAATLDGVRDFRRLAERDADFALFVADDHERAELEAASPLDDFRGAIDEDHLFDGFVATLAKGVFADIGTTATTAATAALTATATKSTAPATARFRRRFRRFGSDRRNYWNVFVFSHNKFSGSG